MLSKLFQYVDLKNLVEQLKYVVSKTTDLNELEEENLCQFLSKKIIKNKLLTRLYNSPPLTVAPTVNNSLG